MSPEHHSPLHNKPSDTGAVSGGVAAAGSAGNIAMVRVGGFILGGHEGVRAGGGSRGVGIEEGRGGNGE